MSVTAIDGVTAAGHLPTWIIPAATITADPVAGTWSIPLTAVTGATTEKIDCHMDFGDMSIAVADRTRERQRMCQTVVENIKIGETIDITISAVFDQQELETADVNAAYAALPEDGVVYLFRAYGWDSAVTPTTSTKGDLYKATVQSRIKSEPTTADEDLKFLATLSGSARFMDIALTGV